MVTRGLHIVGYPTLTGLLCNSVPITSFTAQRMLQARYSLPSSAVQLHGLKCIVQTAPFGCEAPCPLRTSDGSDESCSVCLSLLSVLALSPEISQNKRFRDAQEKTLEHYSPGVPWASNPTSHLQHRSPVVAKPADSHLSHMHSITCCCSGYFLVSFMPPKSTMVLCPQVLESGIPNKTVRWLCMPQWAGIWNRSLPRGLCYTSDTSTRVNERLDSAGSIDQRPLLSWICRLL